MDCLDLPAKKKIEQLTFSSVLYFTSFVSNSQFPVLLSIHFRFSILQIQLLHLINCMKNQINQQTNKYENK